MFLCRNRQYLHESSMFCGGTFFQWNGCFFTMKWAFFEENKKKKRANRLIFRSARFLLL